ncbi:holo-ACP synthase [candidate division KSB1 bacterium]
MAHSDIIGIGVDTEQIERFAQKPFSENERFYRKLFTQQEIDYCTARKNPYPHFTARFCAKEALAKALPEARRPGWKEVAVLNRENGEPFLHFDISDNEKARYIGSLRFHLSLSHDNTGAIAFIVVTGNRA